MSLKKPKPGWHKTEEGYWYWWDGEKYIFEVPPNNNPNAEPGWYVWKNDLERWWSRDKQWIDAYRAENGRVDVVNNIGQTALFFTTLEIPTRPIEHLRSVLAYYPPCKISSLNLLVSAIAHGYDYSVLVEWE